MAGDRQPIAPSTPADAGHVVAALPSGHVQRYAAPRPGADPGPGATTQATAASPALAAPRQSAAAAMLAQELGPTFEQKHVELCGEAAGIASEFGADVSIYVLAPDGSRGACDRFPGWPWGEQATTISQLLDKDVAKMGLEEFKAHEARLLELRAALVGKIQEIETARAAAAAGPSKI